MLAQADDLSGEKSALNLPATDRERRNWRRKVSVDANALWQTPVGLQAIRDLAARRRR
jgi:glycogen operon protein